MGKKKSSLDQPVHLIGHSTAGLLGWLYTRHYRQRVRSRTLLGVGVYPALDWQAHYSAFQVSEVHRQIPHCFKKSGILLRDCTSSTTKSAVLSGYAVKPLFFKQLKNRACRDNVNPWCPRTTILFAVTN